MNKLDKRAEEFKNQQHSQYMSDYSRGKIDATMQAADIIGSCNICQFGTIQGSNLICGFMVNPVSADGYCNYFEKRGNK